MKGNNRLMLSPAGMAEVAQKWINDHMYRADVVVDSVSYDSNINMFTINLREKPPEEKK